MNKPLKVAMVQYRPFQSSNEMQLTFVQYVRCIPTECKWYYFNPKQLGCIVLVHSALLAQYKSFIHDNMQCLTVVDSFGSES
jgi:hypothetical protein